MEGNEFFFFNFNGGASGLSPPPWLRGADRTKLKGLRFLAIGM